MIIYKFYFLILLLPSILLLNSCNFGENDDGIDLYKNDNAIVFTAQYGSFPYKERIVIADFYNPSDYRFITDTSEMNSFPFISRKKAKVIFTDRFEESYGATLIYQETKRTIKLPFLFLTKPNQIIWGYNDSQFYYGGDLYNTETMEIIHTPIDGNVIGLNTVDSLLVVFCVDEMNWEGLDWKGHIAFYREDGTVVESWTKLPFTFYNVFFVPRSRFDWNNNLGYIVSTAINYDIENQGNTHKLILFEPDGNLVKEFGQGSSCENPCWGPDDQILFERCYPNPSNYEGNYTLWIYDYKTDQVHKWADPELFEGAVSLRYPDW